MPGHDGSGIIDAVGRGVEPLVRWHGHRHRERSGQGPVAQAAGADCVLDYRSQDAAREVRRIAPAGVDTIVEVAAGANAALDAGVAEPA